MERPSPAYRGTDPYLFVSYAHDDEEEVYQDLARLSVAADNAEGYLSAGIERIGAGLLGQLRQRLLTEIDGVPDAQLDAMAG